MEITAGVVKELRERTGVGFMDCKQALQEAGGDLDEAVKVLRRMGKAKAEKRASRAASEGRIESYVHMGGKIAVLLELNSETDFVTRSDDFQDLARELAMQVAAASPRFVRREDVDDVTLDAEREVYRAQAVEEGKPEKIIDRIVDGKIGKFYSEICLYDQPFVKDQDQTVGDLITSAIARIGENIVVSRFARFAIGDDRPTLAVAGSGTPDDE